MFIKKWKAPCQNYEVRELPLLRERDGKGLDSSKDEARVRSAQAEKDGTPGQPDPREAWGSPKIIKK